MGKRRGHEVLVGGQAPDAGSAVDRVDCEDLRELGEVQLGGGAGAGAGAEQVGGALAQSDVAARGRQLPCRLVGGGIEIQSHSHRSNPSAEQRA